MSTSCERTGLTADKTPDWQREDARDTINRGDDESMTGAEITALRALIASGGTGGTSTLRTGTLSDLLEVAGTAGEISYPTDQNTSRVLHDGVAGEALEACLPHMKSGALLCGDGASATYDADNEGAAPESLDSIAIGKAATCSGSSSVAIGIDATSDYASVAIGASAQAPKPESVSIGKSSQSANCSVAVGSSSAATSDSSLAVGMGAVASADSSIAIGASATASATNAIAIGVIASATQSGEVQVGTDHPVRVVSPNENTSGATTVTLRDYSMTRTSFITIPTPFAGNVDLTVTAYVSNFSALAVFHYRLAVLRTTTGALSIQGSQTVGSTHLDDALSGISVDISAGDDGYINVACTGIASTSIFWRAVAERF